MPEADTVAPKTLPAPSPTPPERVFVVPKRPTFTRILDSQLIKDDFARNLWVAKPDRSISKDDMLKPTFWAHVVKNKLRRGDRIEVLAEDGTWFAELIVRAINGVEVVMGELRHVRFDGVSTRSAADYDTKWVSPAIGYRVTRTSDGVVVKEGLMSKEAIAAWLAEPLLDKAA